MIILIKINRHKLYIITWNSSFFSLWIGDACRRTGSNGFNFATSFGFRHWIMSKMEKNSKKGKVKEKLCVVREKLNVLCMLSREKLNVLCVLSRESWMCCVCVVKRVVKKKFPLYILILWYHEKTREKITS
jgi:hypothetical protein